MIERLHPNGLPTTAREDTGREVPAPDDRHAARSPGQAARTDSVCRRETNERTWRRLQPRLTDQPDAVGRYLVRLARGLDDELDEVARSGVAHGQILPDPGARSAPRLGPMPGHGASTERGCGLGRPIHLRGPGITPGLAPDLQCAPPTNRPRAPRACSESSSNSAVPADDTLGPANDDQRSPHAVAGRPGGTPEVRCSPSGDYLCTRIRLTPDRRHRATGDDEQRPSYAAERLPGFLQRTRRWWVGHRAWTRERT